MERLDYSINSDGQLISNKKEVNMEFIGTAGLGLNAPKIVMVDGTKGFLKVSANTTQTFDKFEFLISKLGKYMNIKTANEYFIVDNNSTYLLSESVTNDSLGQELIMASDIDRELVVSRKASQEEIMSMKKESEDFKKEIVQARDYTIPKVDNDQIDKVINIFIDRVKMMKLDNEEEIIEDYIKMCFFDILTGNQDRNTNNYGLIKNSDGTYSFAPLFDSSTIAIPELSPSLCQINNYLIDKSSLLKYLLRTYPNYLDDVINVDMDKVGYDMNKLSQEVLNEKEYKWFNDAVLNRLNNETFNMVRGKKLG